MQHIPQRGGQRFVVSNGEDQLRRAPLHELMNYEGRQAIQLVGVIDTHHNSATG